MARSNRLLRLLHALRTTGAGGAATGTLAGAANRIDLFPFIPRDDIVLDRLAVNVTTLIASELAARPGFASLQRV